ncbi:threonylcarbamoyl-AMP synthase [Myxococcota bacterium]|nr:threonylcarbamoyl-AMP synthase [Myxococcota bacterium]MBU1433106.1 threonylcarbamoyl-AMP synthase [Myxococcota bacterium]MBU1900257.1 threonylcarbamoyl-AMP synthase [Myxococcota bacterium]
MLKRLTIEEGVERLRAGGVLVFPTETSYGLGCRAMDSEAVARVVGAKGRPSGKPLPILLPGASYLKDRDMETPLQGLAEVFWPGALTLVVPAFPGLSAEVTAGTNMVGVRVSAHPIARALVEALGEPLVATSANHSGAPAATDPAAADAAELEGVDGLIDGGALPGGASTVVGFVAGQLEFYRRGPISEEAIRAEWARLRAR